MTRQDDLTTLDRTDYIVVAAVGIGALIAYVRTMAPDVLYGDSAEFQTLAYTLGMTHSTGYPIYIVLARLLGFLPLATSAWRVNLLSALAAAGTVSGVYLLIRHLTRSRIGAALGSIAFGFSYTFWSQAIIAEVYTPGTLFLVLAMLLLWHWHRTPSHSHRALFCATFAVGLGLGVHLSVVLIVPATIVLVAWTLWSGRATAHDWRRGFTAAFVGLALGIGVFLIAFFLVDAQDTTTSFLQVAMVPSRSIWGLEATDLDSPLERLAITVSGLQWQDAMFPGDIAYMWAEFKEYGGQFLTHEFTLTAILCAILGLVVTLRDTPQLGAFLLTAFLTMLLAILNYEPPDKYLFFLPTYVLVAIATGAGVGYLLEFVRRALAASSNRHYRGYHALAAIILAILIAGPYVAPRWQALRVGAADFVQEQYAYPLYDLEEPRRLATRWVQFVPDNALLALDWRALYTTYYIAHVEQGRYDLTIKEASPHGGDGNVAETLVQELGEALQNERPVYVQRRYRNLSEHFRVHSVLNGELYRLALR